MKKILYLIIFGLFISFSALADDSAKKSSGNLKECWEGFNKATFSLNQALDGILFEPLAKGYRHLPSPIRTGTSNMVSNISNLMTIPNNLLQGDIKSAGNNIMRLLVNTTLGIAGIFDVASGLGYEKLDKEDYGQTLAAWGADPGCYIVLPILGPSTARDAVGQAINFFGGDPWYNITSENDTRYFKDSDYFFSKMADGVDFRAKNIEAFDSIEKNSIDFYASVKSLYLQDRERKISNSGIIIDAMDDSDWEDIEIK
tara:strand:+ start:330 stop:1100 length:771 start_codon:yes stop_codon:yes gene_type:complete